MTAHYQDTCTAELNYQTAQEKNEFNLFNILKPKLTQDGNQWIVLHGEDITTGIVCYGNSPHLAIMNFNHCWYKSIKPKKDQAS